MVAGQGKRVNIRQIFRCDIASLGRCLTLHDCRKSINYVSYIIIVVVVRPMDCGPRAPLSMGFSRQEYWSGLPFPSAKDLPNLGIMFNAILPNHRPPTSLSTESKRLFSTSVSLLLSLIQGCCYHLSKFHIYVLVYCIGVFSFWLTSLCIIGFSFKT